MLLGGHFIKGGRHPACADRGGDRLGHGAFVEALAPLPGNTLQGGRQLRQAHQLAGLRGSAIGQQQLSQLHGAAGAQQCGAKVPEAGDRFAHRIALPGVGDHRLTQLLQRPRAEALQQRAPAIHGAGDRDGGGTVLRHHRHGANAIEAGAARGPAAAIQPQHFLVSGRPHQNHGVATQTAHHRLSQCQHPGHRHGCIGRIAALLKHPQAHPGNQGRAGAGHGTPCKHGRAAMQKGRADHG